MKNCPICHTSNYNEMAFCGSCGAKLEQKAQAEKATELMPSKDPCSASSDQQELEKKENPETSSQDLAYTKTKAYKRYQRRLMRRNRWRRFTRWFKRSTGLYVSSHPIICDTHLSAALVFLFGFVGFFIVYFNGDISSRQVALWTLIGRYILVSLVVVITLIFISPF